MDFLDISRASLYRLINNGALPTVKLIGARRIPRRALIDLAASRVTVGAQSLGLTSGRVAGRESRIHRPGQQASRNENDPHG